ncbi:hypothetical protein AB1Y20_001877 [Prymnesium parvum]|uniref:Uncharacterized protein n=1 Tax=Prymnesium parvum TaxID=97485 RepID=A0AB34J6C2_PRYPA
MKLPTGEAWAEARGCALAAEAQVGRLAASDDQEAALPFARACHPKVAIAGCSSSSNASVAQLTSEKERQLCQPRESSAPARISTTRQSCASLLDRPLQTRGTASTPRCIFRSDVTDASTTSSALCLSG